MQGIKVALCQLAVGTVVPDNRKRALDMLKEAANSGADIAILPEMFTIQYQPKLFAAAAENCIGGETFAMLEEAAKSTGMTIIGGSIPELSDGRIYNTSMVFSGDGSFVGKYRKAHLFDVDIKGSNFRIMESDTITPGDSTPLMVEAPIKTAVSICFDIRFPEMAELARESGADLLALPAAFSSVTGPRHWELLLRARALDAQLFVAGVSPAQTKYAHGHSMITTPDGTVLYSCGALEKVAVVDLPLSMLAEMRESIPLETCRRRDLYRIET